MSKTGETFSYVMAAPRDSSVDSLNALIRKTGKRPLWDDRTDRGGDYLVFPAEDALLDVAELAREVLDALRAGDTPDWREAIGRHGLACYCLDQLRLPAYERMELSRQGTPALGGPTVYVRRINRS